MNIAISELLLFAFAVVGMVHIIIDGSIFQSTRDFLDKVLPAKLAELYKCYQCCGFWSGVFMGTILLTHRLPWTYVLPVVFAAGCAGSFIATWATISLNVQEAKMVMVNYKAEEQ